MDVVLGGTDVGLAKVHEDAVGLWVSAGGYVARPVVPSDAKVGDKVNARHRAQTTLAFVTTKHGKKEVWITLGIPTGHLKLIKDDERKAWYEHCKNEAFDSYGHVYWQ